MKGHATEGVHGLLFRIGLVFPCVSSVRLSEIDLVRRIKVLPVVVLFLCMPMHEAGPAMTLGELEGEIIHPESLGNLQAGHDQIDRRLRLPSRPAHIDGPHALSAGNRREECDLVAVFDSRVQSGNLLIHCRQDGFAFGQCR